MSQYFGGSEDRKAAPGKRPFPSLPAAAQPDLFGAASPSKIFPTPHPASGKLDLFGDTATSPDSTAFPISVAPFPMFGNASTSDSLKGSPDQAAPDHTIAESSGDAFRAPTGASPPKRVHQGCGRPGAGRQEPRTDAVEQEQSAATTTSVKQEQAGSAAPAPPPGGAAVLGELLATQQRRLAGLVPELEEGQRREEELVAKLEAVLQDSQAYEQRLAATREQFSARVGAMAAALGPAARPGLG